jgi:hypothetical protein
VLRCTPPSIGEVSHLQVKSPACSILRTTQRILPLVHTKKTTASVCFCLQSRVLSENERASLRMAGKRNAASLYNSSADEQLPPPPPLRSVLPSIVVSAMSLLPFKEALPPPPPPPPSFAVKSRSEHSPRRDRQRNRSRFVNQPLKLLIPWLEGESLVKVTLVCC